MSRVPFVAAALAALVGAFEPWRRPHTPSQQDRGGPPVAVPLLPRKGGKRAKRGAKAIAPGTDAVREVDHG